jgi:hypothetical protein
VPTRDIPDRPWKQIALIVALALVLLIAGWEVLARARGFHAGDVDDSTRRWTAERDKVGGEDQVILISDSRLLFGTDLDRFAALTGKRPLQLGIVGSSALVLLKDLAKDPRVNGLVVVGMADTPYFGGPGFARVYLDHPEKRRLPSERTKLWLGDRAEEWFAFIDANNRLSTQIEHLDLNWRKGADGPYEDVWKLSEQDTHRQYRMWPQVERDPFIRAHAIHVWNDFAPGPHDDKIDIPKVLAETAKAVAAIRARGGDVVFVRPPSAPQIRANEEKSLPKAKGWDALLVAAHVGGVHADELGPQPWNLPERSHLSRGCATVFTDMYVRRLTALTNRLHLLTDAPRPLTVPDCVGIAPGAPPRGV